MKHVAHRVYIKPELVNTMLLYTLSDSYQYYLLGNAPLPHNRWDSLFPLFSPADDVQAFMDAALSTFDMAKDSGPEEELFGQFNSQDTQSSEQPCTAHGEQMLGE
ncbi:unnamed protein product [Pleuronectes platessa]|uniref:Uncharacterized protein n=1 Tax=Pleuronectes platessa TaxID=8262 RepID=A0A9N7VEI4_PLEPL|nr:unnamed protein product [Pleuronectes platessa]